MQLFCHVNKLTSRFLSDNKINETLSESKINETLSENTNLIIKFFIRNKSKEGVFLISAFFFHLYTLKILQNLYSLIKTQKNAFNFDDFWDCCSWIIKLYSLKWSLFRIFTTGERSYHALVALLFNTKAGTFRQNLSHYRYHVGKGTKQCPSCNRTF